MLLNFFKKRGHYSRRDIIQEGTLFKEIWYFSLKVDANCKVYFLVKIDSYGLHTYIEFYLVLKESKTKFAKKFVDSKFVKTCHKHVKVGKKTHH